MKPFSMDAESAFDLSTYSGRLKHFQKLCNPMNFFYSDKQLEEFKSKIDAYKSGQKDKYTDQDLWNAKYSLLGNYHLETEKPIPRLFRSSGFVITNIPIVIGLSVLPATPINQLISQTVNQTYNYGFNYCNRNMSIEYSVKQMTFSYLSAVAASIAGSVGIIKLVKNLNMPQKLKFGLTAIAPFLGVAVANELNLFFSRYQDFLTGIQVYNPKTNKVIENKNSKKAAQIAFLQTAVSRVIIPTPIFIIPNLGIWLLKRANLYPKNFILYTAINSSLAALSLYIGLSYALAIFPQNAIVKAKLLEQEFQNLKDEEGNIITEFSFNKGL